ncbi:MAG TPA: CHAT domain-containing protein [Chloroflexia bacterium]|jgi:tetratricopeptide (TPR) repeat protein/CHAT domain-containing protein
MAESFRCVNCGHDVTLPEVVRNILFPSDLSPIFDLLEGQLNVATCPVCKLSGALPVPVVVMNREEKTVLLSLWGAETWNQQEMSDIVPEGIELRTCAGYNQLRHAVLPWLDRYITPPLEALTSEEFINMTREQQVDLFTPFFLRIWKSQIDGYIPPFLTMTADLSPEDQAALTREWYFDLLAEHIHRIGLEAARTRTMLSLPQKIGTLVPRECITPEVLARVIELCPEPVNPTDDPNRYAIGFRQEFLNAVVHLHAGQANPRKEYWAHYVSVNWSLSKTPNFVLDPQLLIPPEIVRQTLTFVDLWKSTFGQLTLENHSRELVNIFDEMLRHYGFAEQLGHLSRSGLGIMLFPEGASTSLAREAYLNAILETSSEHIHFSKTVEESSESGQFVRSTVALLLRNSMQDMAFKYIGIMFERARAADDTVAQISIVSHAAEALNVFQLWEEAATLIRRVYDLLDTDLYETSPALMIYFWNEVGNTLRYSFDYQDALQVYEFVNNLITDAPENYTGDRESNKKVIHKNMAIVYRQLGQFSKALEILKSLIVHNPDDHTLQHTLGILYTQVNRNEDAKVCFNRAIELSQQSLDAQAFARYLLARGMVHQALGDDEAGIQDLQRALTILPHDAIDLRGRLAASSQRFYPISESGKSFLAECRKFIVDLLENESFEEDLALIITMLTAVCERWLQEGQVEEAQALFEPCWNRFALMDIQGSWQLPYIRGWISYTLGAYKECWPYFEAAVRDINEEVPVAEDVSFAPSWLQDKATFQDNFALVALNLVEQGIVSAETLLSVHEFMNGREISARLLGKEAGTSLVYDSILARYLEAAQVSGKNVECFFFLETTHSIRLANISSKTGHVTLLPDLELSAAFVARLRAQFSTLMKKANPSDLSHLDARLSEWDALSRQLGSLIAPYLTEGDHLHFLPGRSFTGLPLHLLWLPSQSHLIEEYTVSYAPNFATLLRAAGPEESTTSKPTTLVSVTKRSDNDNFTRRITDAAESILEMLSLQGETAWLRQEEADHAKIAEALANSGEIIFLCHGTTAGHEKGYGICLAYGGSLPPALLSVREFPSHERFVLTWQNITQSPGLVTSIACSSGITEIGPGGVRLGLEQTLFSSGTRALISPLWDVEQQSSLAWMQIFYRHRTSQPGATIEWAYQQACIECKHQFPHFYFWGPFVLNGSL